MCRPKEQKSTPGIQQQPSRHKEACISLDSPDRDQVGVIGTLDGQRIGLDGVEGGIELTVDPGLQLVVVAAEVLGSDAPMHKYAVQITVADVRDGALSSSTLKEASSWGKVDTVFEQMVYSEATLAVPLIAGYAYHKGAHKTRKGKKWNSLLQSAITVGS